MKIKHILFATSPIMTTALIVTPILTSCSNTVTINFENTTITPSGSEPQNLFGMSGNYKKGTNYEFVADVSKWDSDHGKPESETEWKEQSSVLFAISKLDSSKFDLINTDKIKVVCDGKELKKGTEEEVEAGTADWYYIHHSTSEYTDSQIWIGLNNGKPVTYTSTVKLQNIQFEEEFENGIVALGFEQ